MAKVSQAAGNDSVQQQAGRDIINLGLSYGDVVGIMEREGLKIVKEAVAEALTEANKTAVERSSHLTNLVAERFENDKDKLISAFKDPAFNYTWQEATKAAIRNGSGDAEELIVDLIENRVQSTPNARYELIISKALASASTISKEELNGLVAIWVLGYVHPQPQNEPANIYLERFLRFWKILDQHYTLPSGKGWLEDLEMMNLLKIDDGGLNSLNPYDEVMKKYMKKYLAVGVSPDDYSRLIDGARSADPVIDSFLVSHPFKDSFYIFPDEDDQALKGMMSKEAFENENVKELLSLNQFGAEDVTAFEGLKTKLNSIPEYSRLSKWWNENLKPSNLTSVGRVVAYSSAKKYIPISNVANLAELIEL